MADQGDYKVLIVGAGPAGLLTAQALKMQGANVTVFEQAASMDARPRDWNFGIYWATDPLHECLPEYLQKEVEDAQVDDHRAGPNELMRIYNGKTEELMKAIPIPYNIRLARRRFVKLISRDIDVQYGKKLKEVSSDGKDATAVFEDGTAATGDLLVGAEGAHSIVRKYLFGPEKAALQDLPIVATGTISRLPADAVHKFKEFANRLFISFHPDGMFNWISIHDAHGEYLGETKPGDWTFMQLVSWIPSDPYYDPTSLQGDELLAQLKEKNKPFGEGIKYIYDSIPEGTRCWHNRLSYWVPEPWDNYNGTITLVGDSAHSMTFHRGQGLNNAIHDVADLARSTKEHGLTPKAISHYESVMIPRGRTAVTTSNENSLAVHDWDKLLQSPLFKSGLSQKHE